MTTTTTFRFSPRPNRAAEVAWRLWGEEAFRAARDQDRLVLLAIGAVWCHWCHVMDETSYSDPRVIGLLNEHFIPIRVDNDQRPDVNLRYNLGGWPTTAILTPDGDILTGGTYLPPGDLSTLLENADRAWRTRREEILAVTEPPEAHTDVPVEGEGEINEEVYNEILGATLEEYDPAHGGFGRQPKFPMPEAIALAVDAWLQTGEDYLKGVFTSTLAVMARGGMYDKVEGGFFRYSTTRDWSAPHYEKMLEDNALLLDLYLKAWSLTGETSFRKTAEDVIRYLRANLYQPATGCWSGSQDADEEYYALALPERRERPTPYIDPWIYVEWNALLAEGLLSAAWLLDSTAHLHEGLRTLSHLAERGYHPRGGMSRSLPPDDVTDTPNELVVRGLLLDQVAMGRAALAAFQSTGEDRWFALSRNLADYCLTNLLTPAGVFRDSPQLPDAVAGLARPTVDFRANAAAARWLLALAVVSELLTEAESPNRNGNADPSGDADRYRSTALATLRWGVRRHARYGIHAAGLALAVADALRPWTVVQVTGTPDDPGAIAMLRAAHNRHRPQTLIIPRLRRGETRPRAFVCKGRSCFTPAENPEEVSSLLQK